MCGIVGAVAKRNISEVLLEGLQRLEYRGYDSAGITVLDTNQQLQRQRTKGKVQELLDLIAEYPLVGDIGIAHTRWATHGKPHINNAHPHNSRDNISLVHNGIIENHDELREKLQQDGFDFDSETDSEVIAHLISHHIENGDAFVSAVKKASEYLDGAYALGVINSKEPDCLLAIRKGSPLVIGVGKDENFIASDHLALLPVAQKFIYLKEGDLAVIRSDKITIYDAQGIEVTRKVVKTDLKIDSIDKGSYRHFMLKEIHEQPEVLQATIAGRLSDDKVLEQAFGIKAKEIFDQVENVQIVACGTSYHAGLVARFWMESLAGISCSVEAASEFRYRKKVVAKNTLFVTISQSGETADTLAALEQAKELGYLASLAICNVPGSALIRHSELVLMTRAGVEIGVASTKAFTTQLTALWMLTIILGRRVNLTPELETQLVEELHTLPKFAEQIFTLDASIKKIAKKIADKQHALFIARGVHFPIVLEGALKLKEISYIHAEAYPAGELKHGPLALVDKDMPVVVVAPDDELFEKTLSNVSEVHARDGQLIIFTDKAGDFAQSLDADVIKMPKVASSIMPIIYTIPLQLLAYHVAVQKGTDVDQPRNLAKSVTVE